MMQTFWSVSYYNSDFSMSKEAFLSNHLAGPNIDGEVDELRVFPDKVLDGLQLQVV